MKNKQRTILCVMIAAFFLLPLMGNTALASDETYYFDSYNAGEAWNKTPDLMVDGDEMYYAGTTYDGDVELCNGNTCDGTDLGTITKVEIRAKASYNETRPYLILRPVFSGGDGDNHSFRPTAYPNASWSDWFDITNDSNAPRVWDWVHIDDLDCDVVAEADGGPLEIHCSMVQIQVTYT